MAAAAPPTAAAARPFFDFYIVLDFEATCEENQRLPDQEVIEFPMVVVDAASLNVVSMFQQYVRPLRRPTLSPFCTQLTGIIQSTVDIASPFPAVWSAATSFLADLGVLSVSGAPPARKAVLVTCGDWDLKTMLPMQWSVSGFDPSKLPQLFHTWCNIKTVFKNAFPTVQCHGMTDMLSHLGLALEGRHHSGLDDSKNIARILVSLVTRGVKVSATWRPVKPRAVTNSAAPVTAVRVVPPEAAACGQTASAAAASGPAAAPSPSTASGGAEEGDECDSAAAVQPSRHPTGGPSKLLPYLDVVQCDAAMQHLLSQIAVVPGPARGRGGGAHRGGGRGEARNDTDASVVAVSKKLSRLLRHHALDARLRMSLNGYVAVDDLMKHLQLSTLHDVALAVRDNDKQRFSVAYGAADGRLYIRANQGHSIEGLAVDMHRIVRPDEVPLAVHGTTRGAWDSIKLSGLNRMSRQHIHMAVGLPGGDGVISGMRTSSAVLIYVSVAKVLADGIELLLSDNGVVLCPGKGDSGMLPPEYFLKVVDAATGALLFP